MSSSGRNALGKLPKNDCTCRTISCESFSNVAFDNAVVFSTAIHILQTEGGILGGLVGDVLQDCDTSWLFQSMASCGLFVDL